MLIIHHCPQPVTLYQARVLLRKKSAKKKGCCGNAENLTPDVRSEVYLQCLLMPNRAYIRYRTGDPYCNRHPSKLKIASHNGP